MLQLFTMANKKKQDAGYGPGGDQPVLRKFKPKKGLSLPADEWERRLGLRVTTDKSQRASAKPYRSGTISGGGSVGSPQQRRKGKI
jgi:hypothetical protein